MGLFLNWLRCSSSKFARGVFLRRELPESRARSQQRKSINGGIQESAPCLPAARTTPAPTDNHRVMRATKGGRLYGLGLILLFPLFEFQLEPYWFIKIKPKN